MNVDSYYELLYARHQKAVDLDTEEKIALHRATQEAVEVLSVPERSEAFFGYAEEEDFDNLMALILLLGKSRGMTEMTNIGQKMFEIVEGVVYNVVKAELETK